MANIYIKESNLHGKGLFVNKDIVKGDIIFIIKGKKINFVIDSVESANKAGLNWVGYGKNVWIDVKGGFCDYFNHSCEPNAGIVGHVTVVALKNIKKNTEITFDYSLSESDIFWSFSCSCGSKKCRKEVKSIQFIENELYLKDKDFIPTYFRKIYLKFNRSLFKNDVEFKNEWIKYIKS